MIFADSNDDFEISICDPSFFENNFSVSQFEKELSILKTPKTYEKLEKSTGSLARKTIYDTVTPNKTSTIEKSSCNEQMNHTYISSAKKPKIVSSIEMNRPIDIKANFRFAKKSSLISTDLGSTLCSSSNVDTTNDKNDDPSYEPSQTLSIDKDISKSEDGSCNTEDVHSVQEFGKSKLNMIIQKTCKSELKLYPCLYCKKK